MTTIEGDLLKLEGPQLILHQVNCRGIAGGLAGALCRRFPRFFDSYFHLCEEEKETMLGQAMICARDGFGIAHIFGQNQPGPNTDLVAVEDALKEFTRCLPAFDSLRGVPIYAPYMMGCGLGGGNWDEYSALLERHIPNLIVVKKP